MSEEGRPKLILLQGRAGAGKDTVADMVEEMCSGKMERVSIADPLRAVTLRILRTLTVPGRGASPNWFTDREKKEAVVEDAAGSWTTGSDENALFDRVPITPRIALRFISTIMRQEVGAGVWRDAAVEKIRRAVGSGAELVVVTDARTPAEKDPAERARIVEICGLASAELWWIVAPDGMSPTPEEVAALPPTERDSHTGEPDHTVVNDKSLGFDALRARVAELLE